jgi:hypothetical protein
VYNCHNCWVFEQFILNFKKVKLSFFVLLWKFRFPWSVWCLSSFVVAVWCAVIFQERRVKKVLVQTCMQREKNYFWFTIVFFFFCSSNVGLRVFSREKASDDVGNNMEIVCHLLVRLHFLWTLSVTSFVINAVNSNILLHNYLKGYLVFRSLRLLNVEINRCLCLNAEED